MLTDLSVAERFHIPEVDHRHRVVGPGLRHLGHLLPMSGEGVELQDVIKDGTVTTA